MRHDNIQGAHNLILYLKWYPFLLYEIVFECKLAIDSEYLCLL